MKVAPVPHNEVERLAALNSYKIMYSGEEDVYDQLTSLASAICGTKISLINLVDKDKQWCKSSYGMDFTESSREISFCSHVVHEQKFLHIPDTRKDDRFHDNPFVLEEPKILFYAGMPLTDHEGFVLGSLCVIDSEPKVLTPQQIDSLRIISNQVITQFRLRRELAQKNEFYDQIYRYAAQVPGVIYQYEMGPNGKSCFPFASASIYDIYEVHPEQVKYDASVVISRIHPHDLDLVMNSIQISATELSNWQCDYRVNLPERGVRWLRGFARPERTPEGGTLWHGFITDISDMKEIEEKLFQNSKMAALGEMASGIAHEINNPLAIITGKLVVLKKILEGAGVAIPEVYDSIQTLSKTSDRIVKIVRGLKAFSRNADADPFVNVSLNVIIEDTTSLVQEKMKNHRVKLTVDCKENIEVCCNPTQVSQALMNLISNSYDAIQDIKEKWISVEGTLSDDGSMAMLRVTDCGGGIPLDVQKKIMEPFFSTKPVGEGVGLGLSVSKGLVEYNHGRLYYDASRPNTTFVIEVPLALKGQS